MPGSWMAALMVPLELKSFFGLYPESRRFLVYRAPAEACANTGVAAVADSSTAAARALNDIIVVLLYESIADSRGTRRIDHASCGERASGLRAICLRHPVRIPDAQRRETARRS